MNIFMTPETIIGQIEYAKVQGKSAALMQEAAAIRRCLGSSCNLFDQYFALLLSVTSGLSVAETVFDGHDNFAALEEVAHCAMRGETPTKSGPLFSLLPDMKAYLASHRESGMDQSALHRVLVCRYAMEAFRASAEITMQGRADELRSSEELKRLDQIYKKITKNLGDSKPLERFNWMFSDFYLKNRQADTLFCGFFEDYLGTLSERDSITGKTIFQFLMEDVIL